jgi:flagellar biosynthesis/type III secretory pathway M-ring protein FliF/YscJ
MIIFVSVLFLILVIFTLFRLVFNRKWKLLYTAFGYEKYFRVVSALKDDGIKYKTKTPMGAIRNRELINNDFTQYDIYVKKDEEEKAVGALRKIY